MARQYNDAVESVAAYNSALATERYQRPEHWDIYTCVRQQPCHIWQRPCNRVRSTAVEKVYVYASRRWRVKRGWTPAAVKLSPLPAPTVAQPVQKCTNPYQTRSADRPRQHYAEATTSDESDVDVDDEDEQIQVCSDQEYLNGSNSDGSDVHYRPSSSRSRRSRQPVPVSSLATSSLDRQLSQDKSVICNMCGKLLKNRHGLLLHLNSNPSHRKAHPELDQPPADEGVPAPTAAATAAMVFTAAPVETAVEQQETDNAAPSDGKAKPNDYCDFCLGTAAENRKTGRPEILVACGDCGRAGHPSCLQFTDDQVTQTVLDYHWQCIECKSCGVCGTSDNDDQLLFCDDCDRGYHMFCLSPPISEPPEGKWSCVICLNRGSENALASLSTPGHSAVKKRRRKRR